ncbi:MAG: DUF4468 domain-containing protein [Bacteroidales bacterium]
MNASTIKRFIFLFIAIATSATTQLRAQESAPAMPVNPETKLITYQEVVKVEGTIKDLYSRAIDWINVNYKNPDDATKVRDPQTGYIEIYHRFNLERTDRQDTKIAAGIIDYTLKLELKDGRYRYTITNLNLKQSSKFPIERWLDKTDKAYNPNWNLFLAQMDKQINTLIESLKKGMLPGIKKKEDVW